VLTAPLTTCSSEPQADEFTVGMSKSTVLERFGEPTRNERLVKRTEIIFGPIESFWASIKIGDMVEIWNYKSPGASRSSIS
jgi:hypothetical protein